MTVSARIFFVVLAIGLALCALLGVPHDVDVAKLLAVGIIAVAVAVVVP